MRTTPEQRRLMAQALRRGKNIKVVADVFGVSEKTAQRWHKRRGYKDKPRKAKKSKVTVKVELSILAMRSLDWGTDRIKKGLFSLPKFMRDRIGVLVQGVKLSRAAINGVLKKHGLNGYRNKSEGWKFFRAQKPDELWQLDIKGPFTVRGRQYWFVVCIDDYSRYLLLAEQLSHAPPVVEIGAMINKLRRKPESILTDNSPFKEEWDEWCESKGIKPLHAHPYYPQDKGKVERAIRNLTEEFVNLLKKFPEWLNGQISQYKNWFNNQRFHNGINSVPAALYLGH